LPPAIDGLKQQMGVPVERNALQSPDELFHQQDVASARIVARLHEVCKMLFRVTSPIKLIEFRRLVAIRHTKSVDPLRIGFGIEMTLL